MQEALEACNLLPFSFLPLVAEFGPQKNTYSHEAKAYREIMLG